jgi:hypothetical protein
LYLEIIAFSHWFGDATFLLDHSQTTDVQKSTCAGTRRITKTT